MKSSFSLYWRDLAGGTRATTVDRLLILLLAPFSLGYSLILRLRAGMYRTGILRTYRLPRPVISIGNITVGGTGKTPVTAYIARHLLSQGLKVAVLSRGYGGTRESQITILSDGNTVFLSAEECGDEPYLLATTVLGLIVVTGSDRHAAGLLAMSRLEPDVFLLDDGFQHLRLHRDLNILLLDYARSFGNGWTLPTGLLREPKTAANRADLIIQTRCPACAAAVPAVPGKPFCNARHELIDVIPLSGGEPFPLASLHGKRVLAFAGIAEPQAFFDGLAASGLNLVATITFPDHVIYDDNHINAVTEKFHTSCVDYAITTEKDGVKLKCLQQNLAETILLARLTLTIEDPAHLKALLRNLLQK